MVTLPLPPPSARRVAPCRVGGPDDWPSVLAAAVVGSAANFAVNSGLVALAVALDSGRRPESVWLDAFTGLLPHYVLLGVLAAAMASAYDGWGLAGLSVVLAPLAMAWVALKQYADRARVAPPPSRAPDAARGS